LGKRTVGKLPLPQAQTVPLLLRKKDVDAVAAVIIIPVKLFI
jgi:hypothetical protein